MYERPHGIVGKELRNVHDWGDSYTRISDMTPDDLFTR